MNKFYELYQSTINLHNRFGTTQNLVQSIDIFNQEYNEALEHTDRENLIEEIVDLIVTSIKVFENIFSQNSSYPQSFTAYFTMARMINDAAALARKYNITAKDLEKYFDVVIQKNNAKTLETHYLNPETGKITRKA